jgi:hypothetical protein
MMEVLRVTPNLPNCAERARYNVGWLLFVAGALATFRLSHLVSKERGPLSVFERIRNALPRGRDSAQEWVSCIFCFSLTASAVVCVLLWTGGLRLTLQEWIVHWLGFSAVALIVNQWLRFDK